MEPASTSRFPQFLLTPEQSHTLQISRQINITLDPAVLTTVNLHSEKPILTVLTTFHTPMTRSGALLHALNEANKTTTVGGFIYTEAGKVALKTTTFYPDSVEVPSEQITEIVRAHYGRIVEESMAKIRAAG